MPTLAATFEICLNQRVAADERWLTARAVEACAGAVDFEALRGERCFRWARSRQRARPDAFALYWPDSGAAVWAWCPADNLVAREEADRVPYAAWAELGFIEPTPGRATDKRRVAMRLAELCSAFSRRPLRSMRGAWPNSSASSPRRASSCPLQAFGQGFVDGARDACIRGRVLNRQLVQPGNPLLTWAVSNVVIDKDAAGNCKPSKERARERIDPAVAAVMAVGVAAQEPAPLVYDFDRPLVLGA